MNTSISYFIKLCCWIFFFTYVASIVCESLIQTVKKVSSLCFFIFSFMPYFYAIFFFMTLCHTLNRSCFTKIPVSFIKFAVTDLLYPSLTKKIIISKMYCIYQKMHSFYCPASKKTKYDITFPVLTERCLP